MRTVRQNMLILSDKKKVHKAHSLVRSFVRSFASSFAGSFRRSFVHSCVASLKRFTLLSLAESQN